MIVQVITKNPAYKKKLEALSNIAFDARVCINPIYVHMKCELVLFDEETLNKDVLELPELKHASVYCIGSSCFEGVKDIKESRLVMELIELISGYDQTEIEKEYIPFHSRVINSLSIAPCDIYLRLNQNKHVKIITGGDEFTEKIISKYNQSLLYVGKDDFYENSCVLLPSEFLSDDIQKNPVQGGERFFETIGDVLSSSGVSKGQIKFAVNITKNTISSIEKNDCLNNFLEDFFVTEGTYVFMHSQLISILGAIVIRQYEWSSEEIIKKFTVAAIFHDSGHEKHEYAISEINAATANLSKEERKSINEHSAIIIKKLKGNVDDSILKMIELHNCSFERMDIVANQNNRIVKIFYLLHEFVVRYYRSMFNPRKIGDVLMKFEFDFRDTSLEKESTALTENLKKVFKIGLINE